MTRRERFAVIRMASTAPANANDNTWGRAVIWGTIAAAASTSTAEPRRRSDAPSSRAEAAMSTGPTAAMMPKAASITAPPAIGASPAIRTSPSH